MIYLIESVLIVVFILLSVAFFTLIERNLMGISHYRNGPSNVAASGLSQPLADAANLITNEYSNISASKYKLYTTGPLLILFLILTSWACYEFSFMVISSSINIILLFCILGLSIYSFLSISWGSNSNYSILGGNRAIAQSISYEICIFTTALVFAYLWFSYSTNNITVIQQGIWGVVSAPLISLVWVILCLAESNRTPFDTAEGESEIVSGFNIEYGGGLFALIFISEYGMLLILSFLTSTLLMGGSTTTLNLILIVFFFIWSRCSFPRVRYDTLMFISWNILLPFSLSAMCLAMAV